MNIHKITPAITEWVRRCIQSTDVKFNVYAISGSNRRLVNSPVQVERRKEIRLCDLAAQCRGEYCDDDDIA